MSEFIQVGMTAMRDPLTGEPLEAVPLYVEVTDVKAPPLPEIDRKALAKELIRKMRMQKPAEIGASSESA